MIDTSTHKPADQAQNPIFEPHRMEVVGVAVMHGHAGEAGQDAGVGEGVRVPAAEVVEGGVVGGPHRSVVSSKPTTRAMVISVLITATTSDTAVAHLLSMPCTNPLRWPRSAAQVGDQLDAALHRYVLVNQQIHRQGLQIHPVAARGRRHLGRQHPDMLGAATAADPVDVVLADLDVDLGQVVHLMRALDAHIADPGQIRPAPAATRRAVRHPLIRDAHPRHRAALRVLLLSPLAPEPFARSGAGFALPGRSSLDGGMEELPLLREACRSSHRTRSSSAAFASRNWLITPACSRASAISSSRDSSSNPATAQDRHGSRPALTHQHTADQLRTCMLTRRGGGNKYSQG